MTRKKPLRPCVVLPTTKSKICQWETWLQSRRNLRPVWQFEVETNPWPAIKARESSKWVEALVEGTLGRNSALNFAARSGLAWPSRALGAPPARAFVGLPFSGTTVMDHPAGRPDHLGPARVSESAARLTPMQVTQSWRVSCDSHTENLVISSGQCAAMRQNIWEVILTQ